MNKSKQYILVNVSRIFEGMLENRLPAETRIVALTKERMAQARFFSSGKTFAAINGEPSAAQPTPAEARDKVALLLAADEPQQLQPVAVNKNAQENRDNTEEFLEPDCILYQLSDSGYIDEKMIRHIRRKCSFRDVAIYIVAAYKDLPRAQRLIALGADDVVVFPSQPELIVKKLTDALEPVGVRIPVITKVINPYISAAVDLLSTMAGLKAEKKQVFFKKNYRLFGDISAIMTLSGKVEGEVVVCFEERLAREVVSRIMASQPENLTKDELWQGIGEIVNIIAGNAKAALATTEYAHEIALPLVVSGTNHEIAHPGNAPCIVVIFEVADQPMAVLVSMALR